MRARPFDSEDDRGVVVVSGTDGWCAGVAGLPKPKH
jgi:hypothetical protein